MASLPKETTDLQRHRPQDVCTFGGYVPVPALARSLLLALLLSVLCFAVSIAFSQTSPRRFALKWTADPKASRRFAIEVSGLNGAELQALRQGHWTQAQWQQMLAVRVQDGKTPDKSVPPMLGTYHIQANVLRFEPQFPLQPNVTYRAVFQPDFLPKNSSKPSEPLTGTFTLTVPAPPPTTTVTRIYPTAAVLPENLLKFYIQFSAPMSRGRIYEHIQLRDADGKVLELPFLEIDEELWDPARQRLTLLLDPGRIKRGVLPLEEIGSSLEVGKRYTLTINKAWKDGSGTPLKTTFTKTFQVAPPDRTPLDPSRWTLLLPKSGSQMPLTIFFSKPLDHALALRMIQVMDASGKVVPGKIALSQQERRWTFQPVRSWRRGSYHLVIQTTLEDLAGNNVGKPFDVDLSAAGQHRLTSPTVKRPFSVR